METILIVEEDKPTRQYLKQLIKNSGIPVEVVMECGNGETALEIIRRYPVNVLFTAIHVPGKNGVELVRQVHQLEHPPLMVVISGSDDLRDIVEMMRNGVQEYILKPVGQQRMSEILTKLEHKLKEDVRSSNAMRMLTMRMIFHLLMDQSPSPEEMALLKQTYEPLIGKEGYVMCAFQNGVQIREEKKPLLIRNTPDGILCVLEERDLNPFLHSELPEAAVGISAVHHTIDELPQAYQETKPARLRAFCRGERIYYDPRQTVIPSDPEAEKLLGSQARTQRLQLMGTRRREELENQWNQLFRCGREERVPLEAVFEEIRAFLDEVQKVYRAAIEPKDTKALELCGHFLHFASLDDYQQFFMDWLMDFRDRLAGQQEINRNQVKIGQAIEYMETNFAKDLNMAVVSNHISMNYSLFSHLFKLYTGKSFVNYLKELRIREARRLLTETDSKVLDISRQVGYENEKNFMKVFKAVCGVSPSEYRRNMQTPV